MNDLLPIFQSHWSRLVVRDLDNLHKVISLNQDSEYQIGY